MYFNQNDFGKRLRNARKEAGLTQQELADRVGVERKHISHLECGDRCFSIDLLIELSEVLNVSTDHLLKGAPQKAVFAEELGSIIDQLEKMKRKL